MSMGPWATLSTRITPKIRPRPSATRAYSEPASTPEMITCPIITGVMTRVTRDPATAGARPALSLVPGRGGEARLPVGQLFRPYDHALAVLPLEHRHLVGDLKAVLVHRVIAEGVPRLELEQL